MSLKKLFCLLVLGISAQVVFSQDYQQPGCLDSLDIPSVWTPNGDGISDYWSIHFPCAPQEFSISIFNRWGVEMFTTKDPNFRWTGVDEKGNALSEGVYFYTLTFTYRDEETTMAGNVTLIR